MIKNIIFDLAGVLLNLNVERDTIALNAVGLPDWMGCMAKPDLMRPLNLYLNGLIGQEEFLTMIRPFCRPDATDNEILYSMDAVLDDIPVSRLQRLVELRKKYKVYLLSNLYDTAWEYTKREFERQGFTFEQCFDQTFFSQHMHLAKPDPKIYQAVFDATGINPAETIYFDDSRENIEGGTRMGLKSVLVPMNHIEELKEFLDL